MLPGVSACIDLLGQILFDPNEVLLVPAPYYYRFLNDFGERGLVEIVGVPALYGKRTELKLELFKETYYATVKQVGRLSPVVNCLTPLLLLLLGKESSSSHLDESPGCFCQYFLNFHILLEPGRLLLLARWDEAANWLGDGTRDIRYHGWNLWPDSLWSRSTNSLSNCVFVVWRRGSQLLDMVSPLFIHATFEVILGSGASARISRCRACVLLSYTLKMKLFERPLIALSWYVPILISPLLFFSYTSRTRSLNLLHVNSLETMVRRKTHCLYSAGFADWIDDVFLPTNHRRLKAARDHLLSMLDEIGVPYIKPRAGFFVLVDFSKVCLVASISC